MSKHDDLIAALKGRDDDMARRMREAMAAKEAHVAELYEAGDYDRIVGLCGSEEVPAVLAQIAHRISDDEARDLLLGHWTRCEAHREYRDDLLALFRRAGFVTDVYEEFGNGDLPKRLKGKTVTVYRGNLGEPEPVGLCWTLKRATAEFFCRYMTSLRARIVFGIDHDWSTNPTVWKAKVKTSDVLGYFDGRDEAEVIVDPETLYAVEPVGELVRA